MKKRSVGTKKKDAKKRSTRIINEIKQEEEKRRVMKCTESETNKKNQERTEEDKGEIVKLGRGMRK